METKITEEGSPLRLAGIFCGLPVCILVASVIFLGIAIGLIWGWSAAIVAMNEYNDDDDENAGDIVLSILFIGYSILTLILTCLALLAIPGMLVWCLWMTYEDYLDAGLADKDCNACCLSLSQTCAPSFEEIG